MTNSAAANNNDAETKTELAPIHDFSSKLRQAGMVERVKEYVLWQSARRGIIDNAPRPHASPVSVNLDLTTACNYACDHCVDLDILNTKIAFEHDKLMAQMQQLIDNGLKSVIIIGGGEPTTYRYFEDVVYFLKERGMQVAIVSNGSGNHRILKCADAFTEGDWIRLSLDSGSNDVFRAMHKPKQKKITLESICEWVPRIKEKNPAISMGFSFIIVWNGAEINDSKIIENIHEIEMATKLAAAHDFDYLSLKPFLTRSPVNNAEIVGVNNEEVGLTFDEALDKIRISIEHCKQYETDTFKLFESTNLLVLENGTADNYTKQPKMCHMQFFRQVLSPLGIFNCPVYRHQPHARLGNKHDYETPILFEKTLTMTEHLLDTFDATKECKEVTCLYNDVNWWLEDLVNHPEKLDAIEAVENRGDYFL
jgi:wyosine [tRNA(Phe)-imidazoG37] synthetase (radical SAM superfamily)